MNLACVDRKLLVLSAETGHPAYDFDFGLYFTCAHPFTLEGENLAVLRVGPVGDYDVEYEAKLGWGARLVNSPEQHRLAVELATWYPRLSDLTPRSQVFDSLPAAEEIEKSFDWPIFLKGSRQTSRHNPALCVIKDRSQYELTIPLYRTDSILHWQGHVVREFVSLAPVRGAVPGNVQPSMEYRSFWWLGECVGWGVIGIKFQPMRQQMLKWASRSHRKRGPG